MTDFAVADLRFSRGLSDPRVWWHLDDDDRADALAMWQIRHAHKIDKARSSRPGGVLTVVDLRRAVIAPASLGDLVWLHNEIHPAPKERPGSVKSMILARAARNRRRAAEGVA